MRERVCSKGEFLDENSWIDGTRGRKRASKARMARRERRLPETVVRRPKGEAAN